MATMATERYRGAGGGAGGTALGERTRRLGISLCFAVGWLTEPEAWAELVRTDLGLDTVQLPFALLDPWWPQVHSRTLVRRIRAAADAWDLVIDSACSGRSHSGYAGLLDPDPVARMIARRWWRRACDVAGELGATAVGGPLGTLSLRDAADPAARADRYRQVLDSIADITCHAAAAGLREVLIEPAPPARGLPASITRCTELLDGLQGRCAVPVGFALDIGDALFEPSYGPQVRAESWISALGASILQFRVDSTGRGDPRWGWPHEHGRVSLAPIAASIRAAGLDEVPVIVQDCPQFTGSGEEVRHTLSACVANCHRYLGIPLPKTGRPRLLPAASA